MYAAVVNTVSLFGVSLPSALILPAFLFVITVVVFFHELGHFAVARYFGVKVDVFSIGFGREIVGFHDSKGTRWKISWLPLGGYVKFSGDADPSSRSDPVVLKNMDPAARAGSLHFKPLYQRALVAAAGPLANFLLAIAIFTVAFMFSTRQVSTEQQPIEPPVVAGFTKDSTAEAAGIQIGDVIRSIDEQPINRFTDLQKMVTESGGRPLHISVERNGETREIIAAPRVVEVTDETGNKSSAMRLGLVPKFKPLSFLAAFVNAADRTWFIIQRTVGYLGNLVIGHASPHELSGPLGIAKAAGDFAADGFIALLNLTAYISVAVGFANLLPIPVLDGGHLLYYGFEAILGRPLGERAQEVGFRLGLAFVLFLMLLTTFNDLVRFNLF